MRVCLLFLALCALAPTWGEAAPSKEYQVKAAFLFNFTQFVEWPAAAFADADTPIRIGVLGDDPFGAALDETVRGERVQNRALVVKRAVRIEDLKDCHLLFVSQSEKGGIEAILAALAGVPVLTVSDLDGFAADGGGIRLYLAGRKVRFEINADAAQRHNLKLSAQLLNLAKNKPGGG